MDLSSAGICQTAYLNHVIRMEWPGTQSGQAFWERVAIKSGDVKQLKPSHFEKVNFIL